MYDPFTRLLKAKLILLFVGLQVVQIDLVGCADDEFRSEFGARVKQRLCPETGLLLKERRFLVIELKEEQSWITIATRDDAVAHTNHMIGVIAIVWPDVD